MTFQLVLATDDIFGFEVDAPESRLKPGWSRDVDEAPVRADAIAGDALVFAEQEARVRHLIR